MSSTTVEIAADVAQALRLPADEIQSRLRRELALRLYQKRLLSFGKSRALASVTKWEFHDLLAAEGVTRQYDLEELQVDLRSLDAAG